MKKTKILIVSFLMLGIGFLISSCEPESLSLGSKLDKSEIDFEIVQDFSVDPGGNTVILTNKTPGVVLTWDYVTGRSNKKTETVKYAFKGDYTIKVSAVTEGGIVELDPVTITVTDDNLNYVNDPLWTALTGGVGNSKIWYMDYNANSETKYFTSPVYFSGNEIIFSDVPGEYGCEGDPDTSEFCWVYAPTTPGDNWVAVPHDFGYMEFSLDGGPFVTAHHNTYDGATWTDEFYDEEGTFFLDADNKTLTLNNVKPLRNSWADNDIQNWTDYRIISLTEDVMQIGAFHAAKDELLIFNFISKEYSDNWVPQDLPDPNPEIDLNGGSVDDLLSVTTTTSKTWVMSAESPFNWTDLNGTFLNNWNSVADYENSGWAPYSSADQSSVIKNKITFNNDGTVSTIDSNDVEATGTYSTSTDGTNVITFTDISPSFPIGTGWASVSTTSDNQWKIVKTKVTGGSVTDIWFGKRDETGKDEYMVYHFVLDDNVSGGGSEPVGTVVAFDNSKLDLGDLEGNGNLRLELYNEYGSTVSDPPLNTSDFVFGNSVEVTFTLTGITLNPGATGNYNASIYYADSDWNPQGNGSTINVTGDGTYTVSFIPSSTADGVIVFVIDIVDMATDISDISAVTATIDSVVIN